MTGEVLSEVGSCTCRPPRLRRPGSEGRVEVGVESGGAGRGGWEDYSSRRHRGGAARGRAWRDGPWGSRLLRSGPAVGFPRLGELGGVASGPFRARGWPPSSSSAGHACPPPLWRVSCRRSSSLSSPPKEEGLGRPGPLGCGAGFSGNGRRQPLGVRNWIYKGPVRSSNATPKEVGVSGPLGLWLDCWQDWA